MGGNHSTSHSVVLFVLHGKELSRCDKMLGVWCLWLTLHVIFVSPVTGGRRTSGRDLDFSPPRQGGRPKARGLTRDKVGGREICGDGLCECTETRADCCCGKVTYIPKLPEDITDLDFSNNGLMAITRDDFFINVTHLESIDLSKNELGFIHPKAFIPLTALTYVYLRNNKLTFAAATPAFLPTLEVLDLSDNMLGPPPTDIFMEFPMPRQTHLDLSYNKIRPLNLTVFTPLISLVVLYVMDNGFSDDIVLDHITFVQLLNLNKNGMYHFPETCRDNNSLFPQLETLQMASNYLTSLPEELCVPSLIELDLSGNAFEKLVADMFGASRFPSLQAVHMIEASHLGYIEDGAFKNPCLKRLYLGGMTGFLWSFSLTAWEGAENITSLTIENTDMSSLSADTFFQLFGKLTNLRELYLRSTSIRNISSHMFQSFTALDTLSLAGNTLSSLPDAVFDGLLSLRTLVLNSNRISVVKETTFSAATRKRLTSLDISDNPFLCSCDLLWFQQWFRADRSTIFTFRDNYLCDNFQKTAVADFIIEPQSCLLSRITSIIIIYTIVIVIVTFTAAILIFRFRWHIRLVLYEVFRGKGVRWRRLQEQHFDYDVFVSYDHDDFPWIRHHLMPRMEEGLGLRLCLHQRDFTPGAPIVENIEQAVQSSKKVMMVFSRSFAKSPWCQFELQLCLSHVMQHDDAVLVVLLEDIPPRDWTSAMLAVMKTTTYIEWGHGQEAEASFWGRIRVALQEILPRA